MFKGNIDDEFRLGVKVTKKSVRLFEGFYGSDLILASPVGLKIACEKEGWVVFFPRRITAEYRQYFRNADFLSSIEVVVVDQLDAMTMQNWEHLQVCSSPSSSNIFNPFEDKSMYSPN
jgi:U3 small nucleolar RNA-associated protein 25